MYFLLYLPPFGQLEEGVGCVEEASLEEEDEGDPLVVGLVLHLPDQRVGYLANNGFTKIF